MMQLVSSNGTVLLEREKPSTKRANNSTLHVRRMSQGIKKTVRPVLMSKEEFFTKVIKTKDEPTYKTYGRLLPTGRKNATHIAEDYDIFDFELTTDEMKRINDLECGHRFASY